MDTTLSWIAVALGVSFAFALVSIVFALRHQRAANPPFSNEEQSEWSSTPLTSVQKVAWLAVILGLVEIAALVFIFLARGGPSVYWNDDAMRLQVAGIFIGGLVAHAVMMSWAAARADERDREVMRLAPQVQVVGLMLGLATWHIFLGQRFHDDGAIPMVYNYLIFGSMFILFMLTWFIGVLLGYRLHRFHG